jgi:protein-S-isoprenylcysteine O-methyltransferase Ste14
MTMGTGVVLFVIGAILAFAVRVQTAFISLTTAGYILMIAGIVVFVIGLVLALRGRRTVTTSRTAADPAAPATVTRQTSRSSDPGEL